MWHKLLSLVRGRGALVVTVAAVAILIAASIFAVSFLQTSRRLTDRNLRTLASVGGSIEEWIKEQQDAFKALAIDPTLGEFAKLVKQSRVAVRIPEAWQVDAAPQAPSPCPIQLMQEPRQAARPVAKAPPSGGRGESRKAPGAPRAQDDGDLFKVWVSSESGTDVLLLELRSERCIVRAKLHLAALRPVALHRQQRPVFDSLMVAAPGGRVLASTRDAPFDTMELDPLLPKCGVPPEPQRGPPGLSPSPDAPGRTKSGWSTGVHTVELARDSYTVFVQPCCRAVVTTGDPALPSGLVLIGLVRTTRFQLEATALSYSSLLLVAFVLVVLFLAWPMLKFAWTAPGKLVRRSDAVLLVLSSLLLVALVTLAYLDVHAYVTLSHRLDGHLDELAKDIETHLKAEVGRALRQLVEFDQAIARHPHLLDQRLRINVTGSPGQIGEVSRYPSFLFLTLLNESGRQILKWANGPSITPFVTLKDRGWFQRAKAKDPVPLNAEPGEARHFVLDSVTARTLAEPIAVLAIRSSVRKHAAAAAISFKPLALIDSVLPPGLMYAIVDETGTVVFHAEARRNRAEDLFVESARSRPLRAAVSTRHSEFFDLNYSGRSYRAFARPLTIVPEWSLVVLRDKQILQSANVDILATVTLLLIAYSGLLLLVWILRGAVGCYALGTLAHPVQLPDWIWPTPSRAPRYRVLAAILVPFVVISLGVAFSRRIPPELVLVIPGALPLAAYLVAFGLLGGRGRSLPLGPSRQRAPRSQGAILLAFFILLAVGPTIAAFNVASAAHLHILVKHTQLHLARAFEVRARARDLDAASEADGTLGPDWSVVDPSTPDSGVLHQYHRAVFGTRVELQRVKPPPAQGDPTDDSRQAPASGWRGLLRVVLAFRTIPSIPWRCAS